MKTAILLLALVSFVGSAVARPAPSRPASPVLTSIIELKTTVSDWGEPTLEATGLTATGKKATITEVPDCRSEEVDHVKAMTDLEDGYWTACRRLVYVENGKGYIVGWEERDGDSDSDDTDVSSSYGADIPFDFDLATQTFKIRTGELVPLPERFRQRGFEGLHVLVPVDLEGLSKQEVEWIVQKRGGSVVGAEGPVDVVVLPDRIDFCPHSYRGRNRLAERWIRRGAKVLWERNFGRPGVLPVGHPEGDWRD